MALNLQRASARISMTRSPCEQDDMVGAPLANQKKDVHFERADARWFPRGLCRAGS